MNRGTEQNGEEEDERNKYEVLSVQGSHTLLLQKRAKGGLPEKASRLKDYRLLHQPDFFVELDRSRMHRNGNSVESLADLHALALVVGIAKGFQILEERLGDGVDDFLGEFLAARIAWTATVSTGSSCPR
jgi:hypothetical protein